MTDNAILAENLHKRFGEVRALDGLDLAVPQGTVFGLLGPNGAGKTTAVRVLTTTLRPDGGRARVLGHDVVTSADAVRARIGLAGQYAAVDENLTGLENLRMVGRLAHLTGETARKRAEELLVRFELAEAANRPVKTYSGGMRRKLDLAAALVHRPPVVFLDEPTTGLDPHSRTELWAVISELVADGTTILLTTQYLEEADRLAESVAVVDHGKVIASGAPAELKADMGATVLGMTFADETKATRAADALTKLGRRKPVRDGAALELTVDDGARVVVEALQALSRRRIKPTGLALREPSLDDVFLALTGHKASVNGGGEPNGNGSRAREGRSPSSSQRSARRPARGAR